MHDLMDLSLALQDGKEGSHSHYHVLTYNVLLTALYSSYHLPAHAIYQVTLSSAKASCRLQLHSCASECLAYLHGSRLPQGHFRKKSVQGRRFCRVHKVVEASGHVTGVLPWIFIVKQPQSGRPSQLAKPSLSGTPLQSHLAVKITCPSRRRC